MEQMMEFGVGRQGVGKHVESFLQEAITKPKDQLIIYWVTVASRTII